MVRAQTETAQAETIAPSDVPALIVALNDPQASQDDRDTAARRLLSRPGEAALAAIATALADTNQRGVQLAAARALVGNPHNDPAFVPPLLSMLATARTVQQMDAAAQALTVFKGNDEVITRLVGIARDGADANLRISAIRACGSFVDRRVVITLLDLTDPNAQPESINQAAREALGYLSGIDPSAMDNQQWREWWAANSEKTDEQFRADVARARSVQLDLSRNELNTLADEVSQILRRQYAEAPTEQAKSDLLRQFLRSNNAVVRRIGCNIAAGLAFDGRLPPPVQQQLRSLIGDASPEVRREVAQALGRVNDAEAFIPLLTQLQQETDSSARAAIARALRPFDDVRAVPVLLRLLDDKSVATAQAAASALGGPNLGARLRAADPVAADAAADKIFAVLNARTGPINNVDLRDELIRALIPLQSKSLALRLAGLLDGGGEQVKIRRSLVAALGEMRDPRFADTIVRRFEDKDPTVKLEAVRALGKVSKSFEWERQVFALANDAQQDVREAAWSLMEDLFKNATIPQLNAYSQKLKSDPARQIVVLRALRDRAAATGDSANVAIYNQQVGDAAQQVNAFEESIRVYNDAIAYYAQRPERLSNEEYISESLMTALLRAKRYPEAIAFAQKQISKRQGFNDLVIPPIKQEVERLIALKDFNSALDLLSQTQRIKLSETQASNFRLMSQDIENQLRQQNRTPYPPPLYSQQALAS